MKTFTVSAMLASTLALGAAQASDHAITDADVQAAQEAWGAGIVTIGAAYTAGEDYEAAARAHIEQFYAYDGHTVLFKPTLASEDQFRGDFDEALSYFVGGEIEEDGGFAIAPYTQVLQRALDFLDFEAFDHVADLNVLIVLERHAALGAGAHFRHFVLEALERGQLPSWITVSSRSRRTPQPRFTTPSVTRQPATLPTLVMLKTSRISA
jgi:hypothetical protein